MRRVFTFSILLTVFFTACREETPELGTAPSPTEANFSFTESTQTPNILNFTANSSSTQIFWDFGNGTSAQGKNVQGVFPLKGDYTVTVKVYTQGGSATASQQINIANSDLTLLQDSLLTWLTGGVDSVNGKTWVIDSNSTTHFGVGPDKNHPDFDGFYPKWYSAAPVEKGGTGLYNDEYRFRLVGFGFDMITKGDIYVHTDHQGDFPGAFQNKGDYTAPYPDQLNSSWQLAFDAGADTTLTFPSNSWLGMNTKVNTYRILSISRNHMFLVQGHDGNPDLAWYTRLIPKGYSPSTGGGGSNGFPLPFDFEVTEPTFEAFGNSTVAVINNPDTRPGTINSSARVLETVHGDQSWAGVAVNLDSKLDFSSDSLISMKIWAERAGVMRVKIEDQNDTSAYVQKDINIPVAFNWIEVKVGFDNSASGKYDKLALFPGWNTTSSDKYYLDDIKQDQ